MSDLEPEFDPAEVDALFEPDADGRYAVVVGWRNRAPIIGHISPGEFRAQMAEVDEGMRRHVAAMPRCSVCGRPMTCGQIERHRSCE